MKITQFDRQNLRVLAAELETALKPIADKYGIVFKPGGTRFSPESAIFKIEGATVGTTGEVRSKERESFKQLAELYGMKTEMLDGEVVFRGELYTIVGLSPRRSKFPVNIKRLSDGKVFLIGSDVAVRGYRPKAS
jgi:hypothetical protein